MKTYRIYIHIFLLSIFIPSLSHSQYYGELIGENAAAFYPAGFNPGETLPSLALVGEPVPIGPVPGDWEVVPDFYSDGAKNCASISIPEGTDLYGTGEVTGPLWRNGTEITLWNTDNYGYFDDGGRRLYQSHPWVLGVKPDGSSFGILADHSWRQKIALDNPVRFISDGPPFRVIVIRGESPQQVLTTLSELTGTIPLPPLWSLGYHQCRYSYYPATQVMEIADTFREKNLPCDVIWMDIDYMDGYRIFTFDPEGFPNPAGLNGYLHAKGFKSIWMIDPGVKKDNSYWVYTLGSAGNHWVQTAGHTPYYGDVWPGSCAFPDFTRPETRNWWAGLYNNFMATGIDGVWNDMNEPAVFNTESKTMPDDNIHRGGGGLPQDIHLRYHNVYGMLMVRATREGILQANPQKRPFVLTRANFLGGQRYAATWTGDNISSWEHLKMSIPMSLNLGLSGQPFSGPDIGGFVGSPGAELLGHWMALGAFYPFSRNHSGWGSDPQEPWAYGPEIEDVSRTALERRYRLLPYAYTLFFESSRTGMPVMLPAFFTDISDPSLRREQEIFLMGNNLMIVPQWADRPNYPAGNWRPVALLDDDAENDGYQPDLYLRSGSILPLGPVIQRTTDYNADSVTLLIAPNNDLSAEGYLYHDAGEGHAYESGEYILTHFTVAPEGTDSLLVSCLKAEGDWNTGDRAYKAGLVTGYGTFYADWKSDSIFKIPLHPDIYVRITNLANGDQFGPGQDIPLQAGIVSQITPSKVAFYYNDDILIGEDADAPFEMLWQNVPSGKFAIKAVAFAGENIRCESLPVNIKAGYFGDGSILREAWYDIEGLEVSDLTSQPGFPDHPDERGLIGSFSSPRNVAENYGSRIIGYVHPPISTNYIFSISGDDYCELWLSSDSLPAGLSKIAAVPGWTHVGEWGKYTQQRSWPVSLTAGKKYLIMALHKEGGNDDHVDVAWEFDGASRDIIPGEYLSPYDVTASLDDLLKNDETVRMYPNPAVHEVNVFLPVAEECIIEVMSMTGEVLLAKDSEKNHREHRIDVTNLAPGVYVVRVYWKDKTAFRKLIISR